MTYYKATRPDATSFHDGKTKWVVGKTTKIASSEQRSELCGVGILHASDAPGETLVGGSWPCRLFEVEGTPVGQDDHKYGFHRLIVIRELPAWQALGPNGEAVAAHIERCKTITPEQAKQMYAARGAARGAAHYAAWDAAWDATWDAARYVAWTALRGAARGAASDDVARDVAWDAALALVARDLITPEHFDVLYGPWASVMENGKGEA